MGADPTSAQSMDDLAARVRGARSEHGWTQAELAERAGVSRPTVARVEAGEDVSTATLAKVAGALGLVQELLPSRDRGRVRSRVALPEQHYLMRIGELAYTASSMEWTILGDLRRLAERLPASLTLASLEPQTTGAIARRVASASEGVEDEEIKAYLVAVGRALSRAAELRNDLLHARPATHPGHGQRLTRAEVKARKTTGKRFWIDDDWFDAAFDELNALGHEVSRVRPPLS